MGIQRTKAEHTKVVVLHHVLMFADALIECGEHVHGASKLARYWTWWPPWC